MIKTTLFCLKCKIELNQKREILICPKCGRKYNYINGIAIFEKTIPKFIEEYWEEKEGSLGIEQYLAEFLSFRKYKRILDLGCGDGRATAAIWDLGEQIYCLDSSLNMLKQLQRRKIKNLILINGDAKELPFPDSFFDLIISISMVEHIPYNDLLKVFFEVRRVLKPDGLFLVRNDAWFYGILEKLRILPGQFGRKPDPTHINMMTPQKFETTLKKAKFEIIKEDHFPFYRYQKKWKIQFPKFIVRTFATHSNFICKSIK